MLDLHDDVEGALCQGIALFHFDEWLNHHGMIASNKLDPICACRDFIQHYVQTVPEGSKLSAWFIDILA